MSFAHRKMKFMKRAMATLDKPRLKIQGPPQYDENLIKEVVFNEDKQIMCDIVYAMDHHESTPTCFMIHGGGLFYGDKGLNLHASVEMAKRGYNVINLNYPLLEEAVLFEQLNTILSAYDFFIHHASSYQLNMRDVVVMGDSAGAYLTLMSSMLINRSDILKQYGFIQPQLNIKAIGLICIMARIQREDTLSFLSQFAFNQSEPIELITYLSDPLLNISDAAPCFIIGSEEDMLKQDTLDTIQACKTLNHTHEVLYYDKGENKPLFHVFPITFVHYEESQHVFNELEVFFKKLLNV